MIRTTAVYAYGIGCAVSVWLAVVGVTAITTAVGNGGSVGVLEAIGGSFIPMLALMFAVFLAQRRSTAVSLPMIGFVVGATATLLPALVTHWAPGIGDPLGVAHLAIVAVGLAWSTRALRQSAPE